ncbi:Uncharacterised protein [Vibrio cholerae]|nr:Uncharacterised protein [Vibrio cholerae]CSI19636.1 Uncharacterised protein [Vibrio cholerae]
MSLSIKRAQRHTIFVQRQIILMKKKILMVIEGNVMLTIETQLTRLQRFT